MTPRCLDHNEKLTVLESTDLSRKVFLSLHASNSLMFWSCQKSRTNKCLPIL